MSEYQSLFSRVIQLLQKNHRLVLCLGRWHLSTNTAHTRKQEDAAFSKLPANSPVSQRLCAVHDTSSSQDDLGWVVREAPLPLSTALNVILLVLAFPTLKDRRGHYHLHLLK